jgi:hypothetical protein
MHDVEAERTPRNATSIDPIMVREGETVMLDFHVGPPGSVELPQEKDETTSQTQPHVRGDKLATHQEAAKPAGAKLTRDRDDTQVRWLLNRLDELRPQMGKREWAIVLRDLIQLGPTAVPELIAELDATDDEYMLCCLAFAMRGIGDKRAVPALIRAFPKAAIGGGGYGFMTVDKKLLAFMQKHDTDDREMARDWTYGFGGPVLELRTALQKLTGVKHGEDELVFVSLHGTPRQQHLQRSLFHRCAERWDAWWRQNWKLHVDDPEYAVVNLPPVEKFHSTGAEEFNPENGFPHGPNTKIDRRVSGAMVESIHNPTARRALYDLDTGRIGGLPEHLRSAKGKSERLEGIDAWAAKEGYDLMGDEYTPFAGDKPHYVIRGLGLTAWRIETGRWKTLGAELRNQKPFDTGTRTEGLLAIFNAETGRYVSEDTATFLFLTREGSYGVIFVGVEVHDNGVSPFSIAGPDEELRPNGLFKGRRFGYSLIAMNKGAE